MSIKNKETDTLNTYAYTYEVNMIIQVLAEDEKKAKEQLDAQGGYVTSRVVNLKDSVKLFNGKEDK